jgi:hypothetical protein
MLVGIGDSLGKGVDATGAGNGIDLTNQGHKETLDMLRARPMTGYTQLGKEVTKGVTSLSRNKTSRKDQRLLIMEDEVEIRIQVRE